MTFSGVVTGRRLEDEPLITGVGKYIADLLDEQTLHCGFVRSPLAHALLGPIDLEHAATMPGVVGVFTAADIGVPDLPSTPGRGAPDATGMGQPALARERVRHVGDPVAVVVAESARQAADAVDMVWVDYEGLPTVLDPESALTDQTLLFPDVGTNLVHQSSVGDTGPPPESDLYSEIEVMIPRVSPVTIEPLAMYARPLGEILEIWCGHQAPIRLPGLIGGMLGKDPASIRARVPEVGGAFGTKGQFYAEYPVVAALALRLSRPVAWIQRRREQLMSGTHGRGQRIRVRLGGSSAGRIESAVIDILGDVGAYPSTGSRIPFFTQFVAQGAYDIGYVRIDARAVVTNKAPTGPYRGAGRPEGAISIERAVDAFAREAGLPPEEVRRINFVKSEQMPYTARSGATYDSGHYEEALDLALEAVEIDRWRAEKVRRSAVGGNPIGIGIGSFIERAGGGGEYGKVELLPDGTVTVRTGSTAAGQGHRSTWSGVAASVFTVPVDRILFYSGDTFEVSGGTGSFASRSAQLGASAIYRTAREVVVQASKAAAEILEASPADLELVNGAFQVVGSPSSRIPLKEVAAWAGERGLTLAAEEMFDPDMMTFPYGCYIAVVEVELETGLVMLLRLVAVDDCGTILNPMVVEGQLHGSVMQGIGTALLEEVVYDDDGQLLTSTLVDYLIPSASQPAPLVTRRLETPTPANPLGVKGAGEAGCIGVPPAILNAVHDALHEHGVRSIDFPLTPSRVWEALLAARSEADL
jgi:carbon-monoxide dehydrogenase large subunit